MSENRVDTYPPQDTVLEDLITYSDLVSARATTVVLLNFDHADTPQLFSAEEPVAPALPPGSALSRSGVMSYHAIDDGPQPGSSRTRIRIVHRGRSRRSGSGRHGQGACLIGVAGSRRTLGGPTSGAHAGR
jgi:hypothetical protein